MSYICPKCKFEDTSMERDIYQISTSTEIPTFFGICIVYTLCVKCTKCNEKWVNPLQIIENEDRIKLGKQNFYKKYISWKYIFNPTIESTGKFRFISDAFSAAKSNGYPYILWNGKIYSTDSGKDLNILEREIQ